MREIYSSITKNLDALPFKGRVENFKIDPVDIEKERLRNNKKKLEPRGRKRVLVAEPNMEIAAEVAE